MSARRNGTGANRTARRDGAVAGSAVDLRVRIGSLALRNPILTASGTFGYGDEYAHVIDLRLLGGSNGAPSSITVSSSSHLLV